MFRFHLVLFLTFTLFQAKAQTCASVSSLPFTAGMAVAVKIGIESLKIIRILYGKK